MYYEHNPSIVHGEWTEAAASVLFVIVLELLQLNWRGKDNVA